MREYPRNSWRLLHRAALLHRGIGAHSTHPLLFVLLPKLDVAGSSPVARSINEVIPELLEWLADLGRPF
jgi:hypothetical protein